MAALWDFPGEDIWQVLDMVFFLPVVWVEEVLKLLLHLAALGEPSHKKEPVKKIFHF
jgi:hypothetical protein